MEHKKFEIKKYYWVLGVALGITAFWFFRHRYKYRDKKEKNSALDYSGGKK